MRKTLLLLLLLVSFGIHSLIAGELSSRIVTPPAYDLNIRFNGGVYNNVVIYNANSRDVSLVFRCTTCHDKWTYLNLLPLEWFDRDFATDIPAPVRWQYDMLIFSEVALIDITIKWSEYK